MKTKVQYKKKEIDLAPYFEGFPFFNFDVVGRRDTVFYLKRGEKTLLFAHPLEHTMDPENGTQVSSLDFSKFNKFSPFRFNSLKDTLLYIGDKENKEHLNIYALNPENGERKRLTDEEYIYGYGFSPEEDQIAFVARKRIDAGFRSTLKILDLETEEIESIIQDDDEWTFTWGRVLWGSEGRYFVWRCNHQADRNKSNIILLDRETGETSILLEQGVKRSMLYLLKNWLTPHTFLYISNEGGYKNIYSYDLKKHESTQLTEYEHDLKTAHLKEFSGEKYIVTILNDPISDEIKVINPENGEEILSHTLNGSCRFLPTDDSRVFLVRDSLDIPFELKELMIANEAKAIHFEDRITYPAALLEKTIHGEYEAIQYQTFDKNPETGKRRKLHAFLLIPENLPEDPSERRAIITAFYGGHNQFSTRYQILLEAGFIILSPAIRGSFGFGKDFYALIDGDLGGNEVIDLIYGARYLMDRFNLESESQIGLQGGSHGGYEAMRALTFPPKVNGREEHFDWGFAISDYGISNLIDYYETCNIPDWVTQKAGDPETEHEKLMDRSPVSHADHATGPLLLAHGEYDNRVPVEQSRQMAEAMEEADNPYRFEEFSDQGHGWEGLEENLRYYRVVFDFLEDVT